MKPAPKKERPESGPRSAPATNVPPKGNCRVCDTPSWHADDKGPVHACCARVPEGEKCVACSYAKANRNK
jgi:hypothetical protein